MTLKPEAAIRYFRSKGINIAFDTRQMQDRAHATSFVVSGILKQDVLTDVHTALAQALEDGQTGAWFKDNLMPQLARKGWLGSGLKADDDGVLEGRKLMPYRLDTIFRTNTQSAYMAGRYEKMRANVKARPYWQYVAVMDSRTRPAHAALNGRIFRWDDPIWDILFPPNGYNCRCRVVALSQAEVDRHPVGVESSEGMRITIEQPYGNSTRPVTALKDPASGRLFTPDAGFHLNPGRDSLANLSQQLLRKGASAPPHLAALATDEAMRSPAVRADFTRDLAGWVQTVAHDDRLSGDARYAGALLPAVVDAPAVSVTRAVVTLTADTVRAQPAVTADWLRIPALLASPDVVLQDADGSLLYVVRRSNLPRVLRVSLSGDMPAITQSELLTPAREVQLRALPVVTGAWEA
ncbi:head assembly protein [Erwinia typographi]|uniref:Head assembly protein n=2 Tax=Erwinia typographi TaxID=371042 RepID=A0A0A3Z8D5_9GAMM|nr:head assembly protein [Erwinia typographi]